MNSLMLDIETLSTSSHASVISVGICAFNLDEGVVASDGWAIQAKDWHGEIDPTIIQWWTKQNEAAREFSFNGLNTSLLVAQNLYEFIASFAGPRPEEVWANDPDFDVTILRHWYARVQKHHGMNLPLWPVRYNVGRSCRTIFAEAKRLGIDYGDAYGMATVAHNPIDDACNQARAVIKVRNNLVGAQGDHDAQEYLLTRSQPRAAANGDPV